MSKAKILVAWSNYYNTLAEKQLSTCLDCLKKSDYDYKVETIDAGTYEIPTVIQYYHEHQPFDGYIPLGLLLKGGTDHYDFILDHVKACFTAFSMKGLMLGNGIISAPSQALLAERVEKGERVEEAFRAVDYLIRLKARF